MAIDEPITQARGVRVASLCIGLALIPLYPAFVTLTHAPVPGVSVVPAALAVALLIVVAMLVSFWLWALTSSPRERLPGVSAVAAFPAAALLAALLGFDPLDSALFVAILAGCVVWYAAIIRFVRDDRAIDTLLGSFLVSGTIASLVAIVLVVTRVPVALYTIGHGRAIGTFVLPGELAGYLIVYLPVAFAIARSRRGLAPLGSIGLAAGAIAFGLTFSRAGWAGAAAAFAMLAVARRGRIRYAVAVGGAALIVLGLVFNAHHDPSENFTRLSIWEAAFETIVRFPFSGVGPFGFAHIYPFVRAPGAEPLAYHGHSILLTVGAEAGLLGLVALALGWLRFAGELRTRLPAHAARADVAIAIAAGLLGTWVQGLIDTSSVVIFGLWLPMMALAIVCARNANTDDGVRSSSARLRLKPWAVATVLGCSVVLLVVQIGSSALYARAASAISLPAHLPVHLGTAIYTRLASIAPFPFVEETLADDALRRHDLIAAATFTARMPAGPRRAQRDARIAAVRGDTNAAIAYDLDAGDDEALQHVITDRERHGRIRDAYDLERRWRDRLATSQTRPNALAASWWRLGRLALRGHDLDEAAFDTAHAIALAPLNTRYLIDGGLIALARNDTVEAAALFARAHDVDPADASAVAGLESAPLVIH